jgi:hypothetical protein
MPSTEFTIDLRGLNKVVRDLRDIEPKARAKVNAAIKLGGQAIVTAAQSNAAWSAQLPGTVRAKATGRNLTIVAGVPNKKKIPAAAIEYGRSWEYQTYSPTFRHPLFGNRRHWYDQRARPFIRPAIEGHLDEVASDIAQAVANTIGEIRGT